MGIKLRIMTTEHGDKTYNLDTQQQIKQVVDEKIKPALEKGCILASKPEGEKEFKDVAVHKTSSREDVLNAFGAMNDGTQVLLSAPITAA